VISWQDQPVIVPKNVGKAPGFADDLLGIVAHELPQPFHTAPVALLTPKLFLYGIRLI
jgi:hypothetical protein